MANIININHGNQVCQLPKCLVTNEEYMKEVVSANVWNNKLMKTDKVNLLKFLPHFQRNDTHEKKETLKKLFLGKSINFENQIKKFVSKVKEGEFSPNVKNQKLLDLILERRQSKLRLLKMRLRDLKSIVVKKQAMGMQITAEEEECLKQFMAFVEVGDPLSDQVDARLEKILSESCEDADSSKKARLMREYNEFATSGSNSSAGLASLTLTDVVNRCQNEHDTSKSASSLAGLDLMGTISDAGPVTRKRRQIQNGFMHSGAGKYARMQLDNGGCSSDSRSDASSIGGAEDDRSQEGEDHAKVGAEEDEEDEEDEEESGESGSGSDTDSLSSSARPGVRIQQRQRQQHRHERREFRCPQEEFGDFFSLLQRLFLGAHQRRLPTEQLEQRVRHWQTVAGVSQDGSRRWATLCSDWAGLVPSALLFLSTSVPALVDHRKKLQVWRWKKERLATDLFELCRTWRQSLLSGGGSSGASSKGQLMLASISGMSQPTAAPSEDAPPPPLNPTSWQCRPSTSEERHHFQIQERRRFARPWRGFIYNVHGYSCVVAPVRGASSSGNGHTPDSGGGRARGHPLLLADRPAHVTIVEIVRDAVARLPNGQGSRADIAALAADSGFWAAHAQPRSVSQCVSSALDRLQGESGSEPSVRYSARQKLWFYRHRHLSQQEMEAMHSSAASTGPRRDDDSPLVRMHSRTSSSSNGGAATSSQLAQHHFQQQQQQQQHPFSQHFQQQQHFSPHMMFPRPLPQHQSPMMCAPNTPAAAAAGEMPIVHQHTSYQQFSQWPQPAQAISNARELLHHPQQQQRLTGPPRYAMPPPPPNPQRLFVYGTPQRSPMMLSGTSTPVNTNSADQEPLLNSHFFPY